MIEGWQRDERRESSLGAEGPGPEWHVGTDIWGIHARVCWRVRPGGGLLPVGKQARVKAKLFLGGGFLERSGESSHGTCRGAGPPSVCCDGGSGRGATH